MRSTHKKLIMEVNRWNVFITYFNSLKNFYIQRTNDQQTIQEITSELQQHEEEFLNLNSIKPGDLVAAKYDNDGLWYRAKILNFEENFTYTVQFIDYGNSELSSSFKQLPKKLGNYRAMAYHCMLDNVEEEEKIIIVNNDVYNILFEFITSIELVMTILNDKEPFVVNMKWDKRDIKIFLNNLISYGITPKIYETLKTFCPPSSKMKVNVIYTESIDEFYVETDDSEEIKNKVKYELENGTVWKPIIEYKIGEMVIAKSETDNKWYRVRIVKIHENGKCTCYFIDYGVQDNCSEFYEAVDYLKTANPIIKRCSLYMPNIKTKQIMFTSLSLSFKDELKLCKNRNMFMTIIKSGEPYVVQLDIDGLNMARVIEPKSVNIFNFRNINAFTVQINTSKRCALFCELNQIKTLSLVKKPIEECLYGTNIEDKWYRVKFNKYCNKKSMNVILVDKGGISVNVKELFALPEHLKSVKYLYISCTLGLDENHYSSKKLEQICDSNEEFLMVILQSNTIEGHLIHLFLNNKNITDMIKRRDTY